MAVLKLLTKHRASILLVLSIMTIGATIFFRHGTSIGPNRYQFIWNVSKIFDPLLDDYLVYPDEILPLIGKYLISKTDQCSSSTRIVFLVPSALANRAKRDSIRRTWAVTARSLNMPVFFLLGHSNQPKVMSSIRKEEDDHRDIIQWSFLDTYKNNTIKMMLMLSWIDQECSLAEFAYKVDDDIYVDVVRFYNRLVLPVRGQEMAIYGNAWNHIKFKRHGKHYFPMTIHVNRSTWPTSHVTSYLMVKGVAGPLLQSTINLLPALFIEDVFITGIAAAMANINSQLFTGCYTDSNTQNNCNNIMARPCIHVKASRVKHDASKIIIRNHCNPSQMLRAHKMRIKGQTIN